MWKQITTRWIRLQRKSAAAAQQAPEETESPFDTESIAKETVGGSSAESASQTEPTEIATLVLAAWQAFFISFRDDEREMEFQHYLAAGLVVNDRLKQGGLEKGLDQQTVRLMLVLLKQFIEDRFLDIDERINDLMATCQQLRARLDSSELTKCYQDDELKSCERLVRQTLSHHRVQPDPPVGVMPTSAELKVLLAALTRPENLDASDHTPRTPLGVVRIPSTASAAGKKVSAKE